MDKLRLLSFNNLTFCTLFILFFVYSITILFFETNFENENNKVTEKTRDGKLILQEKNCIACHQIYGLGGNMGPDLTNAFSRSGEEKIKVFLEYGTQKMPNFNLSKVEITKILEYLKYIDKTGTYPIKKFTLNWNGTVEMGN